MKTLILAELKKLQSFKKYGKNVNNTLYNNVCSIVGLVNTSFGRNIKELLIFNSSFEDDFNKVNELVEVQLLKAESIEILKEVKEVKKDREELYSILQKGKHNKEVTKTSYMNAIDCTKVKEFKKEISTINEGIKNVNEKIKESEAEFVSDLRKKYSYLFF